MAATGHASVRRTWHGKPRGLIAKPSQRASYVLLALPAAALFLVLFAWPLVVILLRSLDPEGAFALGSPQVTLDNYAEIFKDATLRRVAIHTVVISCWSTAITILLAFPTAYLMSRLRPRAAVVLMTLIMVPFWVSIVVRLFAYTTILGREGVVNVLADTVGLGGPYPLLFNTTAAVVGMVAWLLPFMVLILYAGMAGIDTTLLTAAKTLGASGSQAFRWVYFPLVRGALVSGVLICFVLALGFFLTPAILGGPRDTTVPIYIQAQVSTFQWGTASAAGMLLLLITVAGYLAALRGTGMARLTGTDARASGKGTAAREPLRLGVTAVALWAITGVVLVVLLVPLIVIVPLSFDTSSSLAWPPRGVTTAWYERVLSDPIWSAALTKSAVVGVGSALVSTALALTLARVSDQIRSARIRLAIHVVVYAPLVVPVILLAVGMFDVQARLGLLGTDIGLVLAHAVIAMPLAFAVLSNALASADSSLEQAAWTLGASRLRTFWSVVVPRIMPSIVAALLVTFVTSWDEAVIALFQTGLEKTLPVLIYSMLKSGVEPSVAAVATLLIALVLVGLTAWMLFGRHRSRRAQVAATLIPTPEAREVGDA